LILDEEPYELGVLCVRAAPGELKERFGVLAQSRVVKLPQEELQLIDETAGTTRRRARARPGDGRSYRRSRTWPRSTHVREKATITAPTALVCGELSVMIIDHR